MTFNRIVDNRYDALNPRTRMRAIPAGQVTIAQARIFTIVSCLVLVGSAWALNPLAFDLSPVALLFALGYSYTKRFTSLSHLFLGIALGIAPMGAWVAVRGSLDVAPLLLSVAVVFWLFGFDILYALQDVEFDRTVGLFSIPARYGNRRALIASRMGHVFMLALLVSFGVVVHLHALYFLGVAIVGALVVYEQSLVRHDDISRLDFAFFNLNGYIGICFFVFTLLDILLIRGT